MDNLIETAAFVLGISTVLADKIITTLIYLLTIWIVRILILKLILVRTESPSLKYTVRKASSYICVALSILTIIVIWSNNLSGEAVITYLGFLSAGIAIALKDFLTNIVGWFYLFFARPLDAGDRVSIGGTTGDVIDITLCEIVLVEIGNWVEADQSTGRIVYIPNSFVFSKPLHNYTKGFNFIWEDMNTTVTFESDWKKAKSIIEGIVSEKTKAFVSDAEKDIKKAASKFYVMYKNLTPIVYSSVVDSGIKFSIRYVVPPRKRRNTAQSIWEEILRDFHKADDIDFAYPTIRTYYNFSEGKDGARKIAESEIGKLNMENTE